MEAVFELRFSSSQPWDNMPGMLYTHIRQKYTDQKKLEVANIPEEHRLRVPGLRDLPLIQFHSADYIIQLGPRCVSLVTQPNKYPGWASISIELEWLVDKIKATGFVEETERVGVRYIDFFNDNVFSILKLQLCLDGNPVLSQEANITTIQKRDKMTLRINASNAAILQNTSEEPARGSILDIDGWFNALDADLNNCLTLFSKAHLEIKNLFFSLIKEDYLDSLNPVYE